MGQATVGIADSIYEELLARGHPRLAFPVLIVVGSEANMTCPRFLHQRELRSLRV
jgi:hypothetical protein